MSFALKTIGRQSLAVGACVSLIVGAGVSTASAAGPVTGRPSALAPTLVQRTADSNDYVNADGTHTLQLFQQPVNYRSAAGWQPIDNTLRVDPNGSGGFVNTANSWHVRFADTTTGVAVTTATGTVVMKPLGARAVTPTVHGDTATYPDVWPDTDLVYTVTGDAVKESLMLKTPRASAAEHFSVSSVATVAGGLTRSLAPAAAGLRRAGDGSVAIAGPMGADVRLAAPAVLTADGDVAVPAAATLATGPAGSVRLGIDPTWLAAQPASAFPVNLDPSVSLATTAARSYKSDGYTCTNCGLQFGNARDGGNVYWRSVGHFNYEQLFGDTVTAASMSVSYSTGSSNSYAINVHHATAFSYAGAAAGSVLATGSLGAKKISGSALTSTLAGWVKNRTSGGYFGFVGAETAGLYTYQKDAISLSITYSTPTVPGAPRSVSATAGNASARVSFSAPASNGGATITSYTVTSSPGGKTAKGAGSPLTVTGLTNGTKYTFTVKATNSHGAGPASAASNAVTPVAPAGVPGAPTAVSATAGDASAKVSFSAPASTGGAAISSYTVTSSPDGKTATGAGSPLTVTGLTNGTSYTFTVKATNSAGAGPASAASAAVTPKATTGGGEIPNLAKGWDVDDAVTASEVSCMKSEGFSYSFLYTDLSATDWKTTYGALNQDGMHAVLQQGFGDGTLFDDPSAGTATGKTNVAAAQSVNYPKGADFFIDVESTGSASESGLVQWINNWADEISAAGYVPAVYSGVPSALQDSDLSATTLPKIKAYWQSESGSAPDPAQGYVAVQHLGPDDVCGLSVDDDTAYIDKNNNHLIGS